MKTTQTEKHHDKLKTYIEKFEDRFNVELDATGHEMTAKQNGGIHEEEFWVKDLINTPVDGLNFDVGGWFSIDTRGDGKPTIYCRLAVKLNNENLEEMKALQSRYHHDEEKWGELRWQSL